MAVSLGLRNLLVPISGNVESEVAMDVACRLADARRASITAVSVVEVPRVLPLGAHMDVEEHAAHALLGRAAAIAETYGVTVEPRIVHARDAGEAVVAQTEERGIEMVVIGAPRTRHGRMGPTVEHVLKRARCRVLVIGTPD